MTFNINIVKLSQSENVVFLSDFNVSIREDDNDDNHYSVFGSDDYISPKMIIGQKYGEKVDVWSIRILMNEVLVGKYH